LVVIFPGDIYVIILLIYVVFDAFFIFLIASEMTYTVSGGALNSTQSNPIIQFLFFLSLCANFYMLYLSFIN